jgi:Pyocin activator protein PrtN
MSADYHATLNTAFLLMAQYGGKAVIPVEDVCRDYFSHLDPAKFISKVGNGDIAIPMVRMESSMRSAKGIHLQDLADYLDERRAEAIKELKQVWG